MMEDGGMSEARFRVNAWGDPNRPDIVDLECNEVPEEAKTYPHLDVAFLRPIPSGWVEDALSTGSER